MQIRVSGALALVAGVLLAAAPAQATRWYVNKANTNPLRDGTSWSRAFTEIQPAINAATANDEIWVAACIYGEARVSFMHIPSINTGSLALKANVRLYGGFSGTETSLTQRNWQANETVIDGAMSRAGQAAYHVTVGADNARLDGFTVCGGRALGVKVASPTESGGGMYNEGVSPIVANCRFTDNQASVSGGAMTNVLGASPTVTACTFESNIAVDVPNGSGGAVANLTNADATISGCTFLDNWAAAGAGIVNSASCPTISDCDFDGNEARAGAGIANVAAANAQITGCRFENNVAEQWGGAIANDGSTPVIASCWFGANESDGGGAIYNQNCGPTMINCAFWSNVAGLSGGAVACVNASSPTITNCSIVENAAVIGGGVYNDGGSQPVISNSVVWGNTPDGIRSLTKCVATVQYSVVQGGHAGSGNLNVDPMLIDPVHGDIRFASASPCRDNGTAIPEVVNDINGRARPQGSGYDIGAYEFRDADGDGMPDEWEAAHGFNASNASDANLDADGDGLSNRQEYHMGAHPRDAGDPVDNVYVSVIGSDSAGDGTESSPWQTISHAIRETKHAAKGFHRLNVHVGPGTYQEKVALAPHISIAGEGPATIVRYFDVNDLDSRHAVVTMAPDTALEDCTVTLPGASALPAVLVLAENSNVLVSSVTLNGQLYQEAAGLWVTGVDSAGSSVKDCKITRLKYGVRTQNSNVAVVRTLFDTITGDAVFIENGAAVPSLGSAAAWTTTGLNRFRDVAGMAVRNEGGATVSAQHCDWGVYTASAVNAKVSGAVATTPYVGIPMNGGCVAARLLHFETGAPIASSDNPVIRIGATTSAYDNQTGLLILSNVSDGLRTVEGSANGKQSDTADVLVENGGVETLVMSLRDDGGTHPCGKEGRAAYAGTGLLLVYAGRRFRKKRQQRQALSEG